MCMEDMQTAIKCAQLYDSMGREQPVSKADFPVCTVNKKSLQDIQEASTVCCYISSDSLCCAD